MRIVAHRGDTRAAPENTLPAFLSAAAAGGDAVELDVRLSADGVPVVYHYVYLEAGTDGNGPVWQHSLSDLRRLRVRGLPDAHIPTLAEVIEAILPTSLGLEVELKGPEPEFSDTVGDLLADLGEVWSRFEVTSYEPALLAQMRRRCPELTTALLSPGLRRGWAPIMWRITRCIARDRPTPKRCTCIRRS